MIIVNKSLIIKYDLEVVKMSQNQASELKKMFYTVPELYNLLGGIVSKNCIYQMVKRNEIVTKRFGGKIVIPATWVDRFIEEMTSLPDK